jgi:hypothetical protein
MSQTAVMRNQELGAAADRAWVIVLELNGDDLMNYY